MSDHAQNEQPQQEQANTAPLFQVGERTYGVEEAKTKIEHADQHINQIQSENATLKEEMATLKAQLESSSKLDQVLEAIQAKGTPSSSPAENTTQAVDKDTLITELMSQLTPKIGETLSQAELQKKAEANLQTSIQLAQSKYGKEYEAQLRKIGSELGYDDKGIQDLASSKPEAFKRMFNLEQVKVVNNSAPSSTVSTHGVQSNTSLEYDHKQYRTAAERAKAYEHNVRVAQARLASQQQ